MIQRILSIDPGTRYMGVVVLEGKTLLSYGVHTLRNGERPHDAIGQAKRIVLTYVAKHGPQVVAYEAPLPIATARGAILKVIAEELRARSHELGLEVRALPPQEVRQRLLGNPRASKLDVAQRLVGMGFEELRSKLPQRPKRSALGFRPGEKYWLHMFDSLAVAVAVTPAVEPELQDSM
jgi:Holliday junction resolvasome RuvABC endonuclease subunit